MTFFKDVQIDNLSSYQCVLFDYSKVHYVLYVKAMAADKPDFYLSFEYVQYFSGFLSWQGAGFEPAPSSQCIDLLKLVRHYSDKHLTAEELVNDMGLTLYEVKGTNPPHRSYAYTSITMKRKNF